MAEQVIIKSIRALPGGVDFAITYEKNSMSYVTYTTAQNIAKNLHATKSGLVYSIKPYNSKDKINK